MVETLKPNVVVSKCLGFENCRYNGGMEKNSFIEKLNDYVAFLKVCPEKDSGMSVPRESIRLVDNNGNIEIIQSATNLNFTKQINDFIDNFLNSLVNVDAFILKTKSPSCGIKDAKIYSSSEKGAASTKGMGVLARKIKETFPNVIIEDEGRLSNFNVREHFLTKLYVMTEFREIKTKLDIETLKEFHSKNSLLFFTYSQKNFKELDSILDTKELHGINLFNMYEEYLIKLFEKAPKYTSNINVLYNTMDSFKDKINEEETIFINDAIKKYKDGFVPFSVPLYLIKGCIIRLNLDHLLSQSFFKPYPEGLFQLNDSGKLVH